MARCDGCLGNRRCWVCLGHGLIDIGHGTIRPCHRCYGSGVCYLCQSIPLAEVGRAPVVDLEDPEELDTA